MPNSTSCSRMCLWRSTPLTVSCVRCWGWPSECGCVYCGGRNPTDCELCVLLRMAQWMWGVYCGGRNPTDCELCVLSRKTHWAWAVFIMKTYPIDFELSIHVSWKKITYWLWQCELCVQLRGTHWVWLWAVFIMKTYTFDCELCIHVCIMEEDTLLTVSCVSCWGRPTECELYLLWRKTYPTDCELCVLLRKAHWLWVTCSVEEYPWTELCVFFL